MYRKGEKQPLDLRRRKTVRKFCDYKYSPKRGYYFKEDWIGYSFNEAFNWLVLNKVVRYE